MITLVEKADAYPVSLAEAKAHLRVTHNDDDAYITSCIAAATDAVEQTTQRALIPKTYRQTMDFFPNSTIELAIIPALAVSGITYEDPNGETQTLEESAYECAVNRINLQHGRYWPVTSGRNDSIAVVYLAGYAASGDVPDALRAAVLLIVGDLYEQRLANITGTIVTANPTVEALIQPYRVVEFR